MQAAGLEKETARALRSCTMEQLRMPYGIAKAFCAEADARLEAARRNVLESTLIIATADPLSGSTPYGALPDRCSHPISGRGVIHPSRLGRRTATLGFLRHIRHRLEQYQLRL